MCVLVIINSDHFFFSLDYFCNKHCYQFFSFYGFIFKGKFLCKLRLLLSTCSLCVWDGSADDDVGVECFWTIQFSIQTPPKTLDQAHLRVCAVHTFITA